MLVLVPILARHWPACERTLGPQVTKQPAHGHTATPERHDAERTRRRRWRRSKRTPRDRRRTVLKERILISESGSVPQRVDPYLTQGPFCGSTERAPHHRKYHWQCHCGRCAIPSYTWADRIFIEDYDLRLFKMRLVFIVSISATGHRRFGSIYYDEVLID